MLFGKHPVNDLMKNADSLSLRLGVAIDPIYKFVSETPSAPAPPKTSSTLPQQSSSGIPPGFETNPLEKIVGPVLMGVLAAVLLRALFGGKKKGK